MATIERRDTGEGITYRVKIRIKGHPAQSATFERLTDARRWAQSTEAAIRERRYFKTSEAQRRTLAELIDRYTRDVIPKKGAMGSRPSETACVVACRAWGRTLADVTPAVIAEARDKLARGVTVRGRQRSPSTVNRYMAALSHAFAVAVKEWGWLEDSPLRKVTKPKEPRGRVRYLADDERGRLLEECRKSEFARSLLRRGARAVHRRAPHGNPRPALGASGFRPPCDHGVRNQERRDPLAAARRPCLRSHGRARQGAAHRHGPRVSGAQEEPAG